MRRAWLGRLIFSVTLVAVLRYLAWGPRDRLELSDMLASVGALILGATAMVLSINPLRTVVVNADMDELLTADLAGLAERRWAREAAQRLLRRPDPLTVTWSSSDGHGDVGDLAVLFGQVPARRLVIVGAAGSGKSVAGLLLALDLLAARRTGEPVPVLLPVASWDPDEALEAWLMRRVAEEHPTLTDRHRYGPDALARLVRGGRVLPVLDGLDEMPSQRRPAAIAALNIAMAWRPVVLTCRREAYEERLSTHLTAKASAAQAKAAGGAQESERLVPIR